MRTEPLSREATADSDLEALREQIRRHAPSYWRDQPIPETLRLDEKGLGFDSIGLFELLLALERELGQALPTDLLLDDAMTVGDLHRRLLAVKSRPSA